MHNNIAGPDSLIQKPTFFLTETSNVFGEKLSEDDETLLCLQAQLTSDEKSQFHEVMSLHQWL